MDNVSKDLGIGLRDGVFYGVIFDAISGRKTGDRKLFNTIMPIVGPVVDGMDILMGESETGLI